MNPFSLYVQISRLVFQFEKNDQNWQQLKKLVPYLRVSLQCIICRELLRSPYKNYCCTNNCQYNVCKLCLSKIKNIKIPCNLCNEHKKYDENVQLGILLQCYKSLCDYIQTNKLFQEIFCSKDNSFPTLPSPISLTSTNDHFQQRLPKSLKELIEEGANYGDEYSLSSGQTFSILPTLVTTGTQTVPQISSTTNKNNNTSSNNNSNSASNNSSLNSNSNNNVINNNNVNNKSTINANYNAMHSNERVAIISAPTIPAHPPIKTVSNGANLYSVMYAGSGNKITIKRKTDSHNDDDSGGGGGGGLSSILNNNDFKKPNTSSSFSAVGTSSASQKSAARNMLKRKGCRCGNATPTPGKLTCCGQRCPCYVESKSCIDCKCRGCRNPHRPNGLKVRPHIPELENLEFTLKESNIINHFNNTSNSNNSNNLNQRTYRIDNNSQQTPQQQQQQQPQQQYFQHSQQQHQFQKQQSIQQKQIQQQPLQKPQQLQHQLIHQNQIQQRSQQQQQSQAQKQTITTSSPFLLNPNDMSNGSIQVVGVYTTHLPSETSLPSMLMEDFVVPSTNILNHSLFNNSITNNCENSTINMKPNMISYDDSSPEDMNNVEIE